MVDLGFSTYKGQYGDGHSLSWAVLVRNPNLEAVALDVQLNVNFLDEGGELVATESNDLPAVLPGQTVAQGDEISYFSNDDLRSVTEIEVQVLLGGDGNHSTEYLEHSSSRAFGRALTADRFRPPPESPP